VQIVLQKGSSDLVRNERVPLPEAVHLMYVSTCKSWVVNEQVVNNINQMLINNVPTIALLKRSDVPFVQ
jgi:hypothetical protein